MFNKNFYKNKTILITGATGSIGKSLVLKLLKKLQNNKSSKYDENGLFNLKSLIEKNKLNLKKVDSFMEI